VFDSAKPKGVTYSSIPLTIGRIRVKKQTAFALLFVAHGGRYTGFLILDIQFTLLREEGRGLTLNVSFHILTQFLFYTVKELLCMASYLSP
jgi:hypothetical protein